MLLLKASRPMSSPLSPIVFFLFVIMLPSESSARLFRKKTSRKYKKNSKIHDSSLRRLWDNFRHVQRNALYRSGQLSSRRLKHYVKKYGIKSIINLRGINKNKKWWQTEKRVTQECGVKFYNVAMNARELTPPKKIKKLLRWYKTAPRPILVHCKTGTDRSGEAAAIWKFKKQRKGVKKALKHLSLWYGHLSLRYPKKHFLIKNWKRLNMPAI